MANVFEPDHRASIVEELGEGGKLLRLRVAV